MLRLQRHKTVRRALEMCGALLVLASFYYLSTSLSSWLRSYDWHTFSIRWGLVAAALGAFSLCPLLRGIMWWCLLSAIGSEAAIIECLFVQARANLVKYVPGGFWELAGKAYLSGRTGPERAAAAVAAALDLGCMLATGLMVALCLMPTDSDAIAPLAMVRWPALALLVSGLYVTPGALNAVTTRVPGRWFPRGVPIIEPHRFHLGVLTMLAHWILAGLGLALLLSALGSSSVAIWFATYALAASATIGLIVVVAPAGIGVREAMLTRILEQRLPLGLASFVAILSRVGLVAGELVAFVALLAITRAWRAQRTPINEPAQP